MGRCGARWGGEGRDGDDGLNVCGKGISKSMK